MTGHGPLRRALSAGGLAGALLVANGCYYYAPADLSSLPPDTRVRAIVSGQGVEPLTETLGPNVRVIHGRMVAGKDGEVRLAVSRVQTADGVEVAMNGLTAAVRHDWLERVEMERLSRSRSWLAAGVAAGVVAAMGIAFANTGAGDDGRPVLGGGTRQ